MVDVIFSHIQLALIPSVKFSTARDKIPNQFTKSFLLTSLFWSWSLRKSDIKHIKWFNGWRKIVFGILWIKTLVWPNWGRQDPHRMALLNSECLVKCFLCPAAKMITCCNGYRASQLSNHCWQPYPLDVLTYETQVSETSPGAAYCWIGQILPPGAAWAEIGY